MVDSVHFQKLICVARHCGRRELLCGAVSLAITVCDMPEFLAAIISERVVRSRFSRQPNNGATSSGNETLNKIHIFLTYSIPVRHCNHLLASATEIFQIQSCRTFLPRDVSGRRSFEMPCMVKLDEMLLIV